MKTVTIAKTLSLIALSSLALAAGISHAHGWGGHNPYLTASAPVFERSPHHGDPFAHDLGHAGIDARQQKQLERIRNGIEHGQISRHEARDLYREQKEIEWAQRRYLADGRLSRDEYRNLDRMLDQAGANIREEKHDRNWR